MLAPSCLIGTAATPRSRGPQKSAHPMRDPSPCPNAHAAPKPSVARLVTQGSVLPTSPPGFRFRLFRGLKTRCVLIVSGVIAVFLVARVIQYVGEQSGSRSHSGRSGEASGESRIIGGLTSPSGVDRLCASYCQDLDGWRGWSFSSEFDSHALRRHEGVLGAAALGRADALSFWEASRVASTHPAFRRRVFFGRRDGVFPRGVLPSSESCGAPSTLSSAFSGVGRDPESTRRHCSGRVPCHSGEGPFRAPWSNGGSRSPVESGLAGKPTRDSFVFFGATHSAVPSASASSASAAAVPVEEPPTVPGGGAAKDSAGDEDEEGTSTTEGEGEEDDEDESNDSDAEWTGESPLTSTKDHRTEFSAARPPDFCSVDGCGHVTRGPAKAFALPFPGPPRPEGPSVSGSSTSSSSSSSFGGRVESPAGLVPMALGPCPVALLFVTTDLRDTGDLVFDEAPPAPRGRDVAVNNAATAASGGASAGGSPSGAAASAPSPGAAATTSAPRGDVVDPSYPPTSPAASSASLPLRPDLGSDYDARAIFLGKASGSRSRGAFLPFGRINSHPGLEALWAVADATDGLPPDPNADRVDHETREFQREEEAAEATSAKTSPAGGAPLAAGGAAGTAGQRRDAARGGSSPSLSSSYSLSGGAAARREGLRWWRPRRKASWAAKRRSKDLERAAVITELEEAVRNRLN